jgi:antirestriction protein
MNATQNAQDTPRAWVGCLACYNAGILRGEWFDGLEAGDVTAETLHTGPTSHEELWVFDHEGYGGLIAGECSPAEAQRLAELLDEVPDGMGAAFAAWVGYGNDPDPATFEDHFHGEHESEKHYAYELADGIDLFGAAADTALETYFDWDAWTRDLFMGDHYSIAAPGGGVWVFSS